nr:MAG TPA: hypothetical protein [Caudoviricetes sp.]
MKVLPFLNQSPHKIIRINVIFHTLYLVFYL